MVHPDLPFEQARNIEYLTLLKEKLERPVEYGVSRSRTWVEPRAVHGRSYVELHPLIGRVGLVTDDPLVGRSFYIGSRHIERGAFAVFSWAAPVASLFFQPDGGDYNHVDVDEVVVRRTFESRLDDVTDLTDEWIRPADPSPLAGVQLEVAAPAIRSPRRRELRVREEDKAPTEEPARTGEGSVEVRDLPAALAQGMRAPDLVLKRLAAPRTHRLASVLASLQPDQHELVTHPPDEALLVQGHPGTGKTIVAAYRAAYLVHPDGDGEPAGKVMLIGPTADYVTHIEDLIRPLDPEGRVVVTHAEELLSKTVGVQTAWGGGIGGEHDDVDAKARGLADLAVRQLREAGRLKSGNNVRRDNIRAVYELVATNGGPGNSLSKVLDQAIWMSKLPSFDTAFRLRRYLPLMAQYALAIQSPPPTDRFDHIVVDEAQDVSPIEWNVLDQYLAAEGQWTLVGDMNQRRSDASYADWSTIADHLGLGDGVSPIEPQIMRRGYRSTGPILKFADKLLPAAQRGAMTLQLSGPPVRREPTPTASASVGKAVEVAREFAGAYVNGTVALITVDPGSLIQELGRQGWRRGADHTTWNRMDQTVRLFVPEGARGLEFDAVVVVEPAAFPENLGRAGQLYTSLTRANRELAVVWHRGLPDALRAAARR